MSTAANLISRVNISDVWEALGGERPRHRRARAFWREGDGFNIALNDDKGAWYDHARNEGGGVLDLVQHVQGGTRQDALRWLAERFGLPFEDCPELSIAERFEYAQRRSQAEKEARALVHWKGDMLEVLREQRRGLVTVYHSARRYLQAHPFEEYERGEAPLYDAAWEILYSYEPKIADLDRRIDLMESASYETLLPLFREQRAKTIAASGLQLVKR